MVPAEVVAVVVAVEEAEAAITAAQERWQR